MWIFISLILFFNAFSGCYSDEKEQKTIKELMKTVYANTMIAIENTRPRRLMFEESPHFEQGYVMHEIVERLRRQVSLNKQFLQLKPDTDGSKKSGSKKKVSTDREVIGGCKILNHIQQTHMEVNYLVNIMHEIPRKYGHMKEFMLHAPPKKSKKKSQAFDLARQLKRLARDKKKLRKQHMKLLMQAAKRGIVGDTLGPKTTNTPFFKRWPIEYGWEIRDMP